MAAKKWFWLSGGGVTVSSVLGTRIDPVSAGSSLNQNSWFSPESLPVASVLKEVKFYCVNTGTVTLKIAQPVKGGSFNIIHTQALTVAVGLNTFSVANGTLTQVNVPANSLIGFRTSAASIVSFRVADSYSAGYFASTSDVSGNGITLPTVSYDAELQMQFTLQYTRGAAALPDHIIDEDYAGTAQPAFAITGGSGFTFTAGKARNAGTGLATFLQYYPYLCIDAATRSFDFQFTTASDRFLIFCKSSLSGNKGTIAEADIANNRIILYNVWDNSTTLPAAQTTLVLTTITLATGTRYRFEIVKREYLIDVKITDVNAGISETIADKAQTSGAQNVAYGIFGCAVQAGTVDVYATKITPTDKTPWATIHGDSLTEGAFGGGGSSYQNGYTQRAKDRSTKTLWYNADGGATSTTCLRELRHVLRVCTPRYVVVFIGVNNATSDPNVTLWNTGIADIRSTIVNYGATPIFCTITPTTTGANQTRVDTMNTTLLASGWGPFVRFDQAITVGDLVDTVHPTATGHTLLEAKLFADAVQIY